MKTRDILICLECYKVQLHGWVKSTCIECGKENLAKRTLFVDDSGIESNMPES